MSKKRFYNAKTAVLCVKNTNFCAKICFILRGPQKAVRR
jgi:hypothetical protein